MTDQLATYIHAFLQDYLVLQKGYSHHTVLSYRDTIKLLLRFIADQKHMTVADLTMADLEQGLVTAFLGYLEKTRRNTAGTRNIRLACIHSFVAFVAERDPLVFEQCQQILLVPFKRTAAVSVEYFERPEISALLKAAGNGRRDAGRDYALLLFMYNTGARVQEAIGLRVEALQLERPYQVHIVGKGNKPRICPLWPDTVKALRALLSKRGIEGTPTAIIFANRRGEALTRYGVRYLLAKYVQIAAEYCPSLKARRHIHPHCIRHTMAMHMLQSGVDINTVRACLGHVRLETTNRYAEVNLDMKRQVLEKYSPVAGATRPWKGREKLLEWLESL